MPNKDRRPAPLRFSVVLSGDEEKAQWAELLRIHSSHGAVVRWLLRMNAPAQDYTGAVIGWSEDVRTAAQQTKCMYCEEPILPGQQYRAADTVGNVGGVFAHTACEESD